MTLIQKAPIGRIIDRSRAEEYVNLLNNIFEGVKEPLGAVPMIKEDLDNFEIAVKYANILFSYHPKSPETVKIEHFNGVRIFMWREMLHRLRYFKNKINPMTTPEIIKAAEEVLEETSLHGSIFRLDMPGKTGAIRNIVANLRAPELAQSINLIPEFASMLTHLEDSNVSLDEFYIKRAMAQSEMRHRIPELPDVTFTEYKPTAASKLIALNNMINSAHMINENWLKDPTVAANLQQAANIINGLIAKLKDVLAHRGVKFGKTTRDSKER